MKHCRSLGLVAIAVVTAGFTAGCGSTEQQEGVAASSFASIDEAYGAVDKVLSCETDPIGDPIVPADAVALTSGQKLCAEHLQVDLYPDEDAQEKGYEIWADSHQGEVRLVRGGNWMVVDVTGVATGKPSAWDLHKLAEDLNGEYVEAGA